LLTELVEVGEGVGTKVPLREGEAVTDPEAEWVVLGETLGEALPDTVEELEGVAPGELDGNKVLEPVDVEV
jgi:hypothetical protein